MGWSFEYFSGSVKQYAEYLIETEIDLKNKKIVDYRVFGNVLAVRILFDNGGREICLFLISSSKNEKGYKDISISQGPYKVLPLPASWIQWYLDKSNIFHDQERKDHGSQYAYEYLMKVQSLNEEKKRVSLINKALEKALNGVKEIYFNTPKLGEVKLVFKKKSERRGCVYVYDEDNDLTFLVRKKNLRLIE